ncbi:MAG TPA: HNH endonuclease signature motif containing protein [Candidatus Paceibacterota bacterium]
MSNGIDHHTLSAIWAKAPVVTGYDMNVYRKDICGAWIAWRDYGNRNSQYGWEVDHVLPVAKGGSDELSNLRPLHWQNNTRKSDGSRARAVSVRG